MDKKVSIKIIVILIAAAILTVPSSMLQISHAQSTKALQDVLAIHNRERADVGNPALTWSNSLAAESQAYADQLRSQGYYCRAKWLPTNCPIVLLTGEPSSGQRRLSYRPIGPWTSRYVELGRRKAWL